MTLPHVGAGWRQRRNDEPMVKKTSCLVKEGPPAGSGSSAGLLTELESQQATDLGRVESFFTAPT